LKFPEFENDTLTAGELDLEVGWQQTYSGPIPASGGEVGTHPVNAFPTRRLPGSNLHDTISLHRQRIIEHISSLEPLANWIFSLAEIGYSNDK